MLAGIAPGAMQGCLRNLCLSPIYTVKTIIMSLMIWSPIPCILWAWPHRLGDHWATLVKICLSVLLVMVSVHACTHMYVHVIYSPSVPEVAVVGVSVEAMCPSDLLVKWSSLSPKQLRAAADEAIYLVVVHSNNVLITNITTPSTRVSVTMVPCVGVANWASCRLM